MDEGGSKSSFPEEADRNDLVEKMFGHVVGVELAAKIMLIFLKHGVLKLTNRASGTEVETKKWPDACHYASRAAASTSKLPRRKNAKSRNNDRYVWTWNDKLETTDELETTTFCNVVSTLAFLAACDIDPGFSTSFAPTFRFTQMAMFDNVLPLPHHEQGSVPDIIALPAHAYVPARTVGRTTAEFLEVESLKSIITRLFPTVLDQSHVAYKTGKKRAFVSVDNEDDKHVSRKGGSLTKLRRLHDRLKSNLLLPDCARAHIQAKFIDSSYVCWPNVASLVEVKTSDLRQGAITHNHSHLLQMRCTQPYRQFVFGLSVSAHEFSLLRADPHGTERCKMSKTTSAGVVEIIRLLLGIVTADQSRIGIRPEVSLREKIVPSRRRKDDLAETNFRAYEAAFVELEDSEGASCYYVDYVAYTRESLCGRNTVVWCAYKELTEEEKKRATADSRLGFNQTMRVFQGPYALKLAYYDLDSQTVIADVVEELKRHSSEPGYQFVLLPERTWTRSRVLEPQRSMMKSEDPAEVHDVTHDRECTFSVTRFKRSLSQYRCLGEVVRAIRDVFKAIEWLASHGVLHRDISMGNILLAQEEPSTFRKPRLETITFVNSDQSTEIMLAPLTKYKELEVYGVLHDFDVANIIKDPAQETESSYSTAVARTGTAPYMAIDVLKTKRHSHTVYDDMQSVFFVFYLFFFTYGAPQRDPEYPRKSTIEEFAWPHSILRWTTGSPMEDLGDMKNAKFTDDMSWLDRCFDGDNACPSYWAIEANQEKVKRVLRALHYDVLFAMAYGVRSKRTAIVQVPEATPAEAYKIIESILKEHPNDYKM